MEDYADRDINNDAKTTNLEITNSIYFKEVNLHVLTDIYRTLGPCPCDRGSVKSTCLETVTCEGGVRRHLMKQTSDDKIAYKEKAEQFLLAMLSYDNELYELFRKPISSRELHRKENTDDKRVGLVA